MADSFLSSCSLWSSQMCFSIRYSFFPHPCVTVMSIPVLSEIQRTCAESSCSDAMQFSAGWELKLYVFVHRIHRSREEAKSSISWINTISEYQWWCSPLLSVPWILFQRQNQSDIKMRSRTNGDICSPSLSLLSSLVLRCLQSKTKSHTMRGEWEKANIRFCRRLKSELCACDMRTQRVCVCVCIFFSLPSSCLLLLNRQKNYIIRSRFPARWLCSRVFEKRGRLNQRREKQGVERVASCVADRTDPLLDSKGIEKEKDRGFGRKGGCKHTTNWISSGN